jgi:hypothetical protein
VIAGDSDRLAARRVTCRLARDFCVAVATADRLSALLAETIAREARRAGLSERGHHLTRIRPSHSDLVRYLLPWNRPSRSPRVGDRALARVLPDLSARRAPRLRGT